MSLLCSNTFVTGPGTIYRVRFRASLTPGITSLTLGSFTEFYRAGLFARPLNKQGMVVTIGSPTGVGPRPTRRSGLDLGTPAPNPLRGRGSALLEFTLPGPDEVSFDLLDLQGRRIAGRDAQRFEGGRHLLAWSPPALPSGDYFLRLRARSAGIVGRNWTLLR